MLELLLLLAKLWMAQVQAKDVALPVTPPAHATASAPPTEHVDGCGGMIDPTGCHP